MFSSSLESQKSMMCHILLVNILRKDHSLIFYKAASTIWGENWKFSIALDIANGMDYLHKRGLIHGHLTSDACVLDARWSAKVMDWEYYKLYSSSSNTVWVYSQHRLIWTENTQNFRQRVRWTLSLDTNTHAPVVELCDVDCTSIFSSTAVLLDFTQWKTVELKHPSYYWYWLTLWFHHTTYYIKLIFVVWPLRCFFLQRDRSYNTQRQFLFWNRSE